MTHGHLIDNPGGKPDPLRVFHKGDAADCNSPELGPIYGDDKLGAIEPRETKLGGPGYPPEVLLTHPELGLYAFTPGAMRWPEIPGMVQMVIGTFVEDRGWLVTKRGMMYGGHHGPPPLIEDDIDTVMKVMTPELRMGIRAMQARLARED